MTSEEEQSCPNPLFYQWVGEWYEQAHKSGAKTQYTLKKAHTSLQRYPLCIDNPQDTVQLQGIGQGIADRLAKKLTAWRKENNIPEPLPTSAPAAEPSGQSSQRPPKPSRLYVPRYRSGAFALLIGLFKTYCLYGPDYYIPKGELVPVCEQYTDTPFHVGGTTGHRGAGGPSMQHTAWSGMKTLESKSLAERQGGVKFCLTEEGLEIAQNVVDVLRSRNELSSDDDQLFSRFESRTTQTEEQAGRSPRSPSSDWDDLSLPGLSQKVSNADRPERMAGFSRTSSAGRSFSRQSSADVVVGLSDLIRYPKDEYDVILVVDNREIHSTADRSLVEKELEAQGTRIEVRPLTVGDYAWIARAKPTGAFRHLPDVVLDYVVERKRMDDLCASIRDGRYHEQHARIQATGFSTVFYVVEGNDPDAVLRLGEPIVNSALSRIQIRNGFHLKRPPTFEATLRLLHQITVMLQTTLGDIYAIPDHLVGLQGFAELKKNIRAQLPDVNLAMSFEAYDVVSSKSSSLSVGEIYLRMLMTLRGVSADKALTVAAQYQTPMQLAHALDSGAKVVGDMVVEGTCRKVGAVLAKRLVQFWTADSFSST
ncbi:Crossover junction endonuclease mus81 [Coemansia sp. RSA 552]|nr:Crossover junction endonuclease mus81 [Coemansia sp. RSA 552]